MNMHCVKMTQSIISISAGNNTYYPSTYYVLGPEPGPGDIERNKTQGLHLPPALRSSQGRG